MTTAPAPEEDQSTAERPETGGYQGNPDDIGTEDAQNTQFGFNPYWMEDNLQEAADRALARENGITLWLRRLVAFFIMLLLALQNYGIWLIIMDALHLKELGHLELIFSVLVGGTLAQSYLILSKITDAIFQKMNHHDAPPPPANPGRH
ncbi:MAG TPA: hypothetical protein VMT30_03495 [Candidatus Saccharimonadia bacterium]|nr:hypothetical protein [Candidatus Saccharimonadia bacterium]